MKKIVCALLIVCFAFSLVACGGGNKQPDLPAGYARYSYNKLSFAYPEGWTQTSNAPLIIQDVSVGNNISIVSEPKNAFYETMTAESYYNAYAPQFAAMGMTISNVTLKRETTNGLSVIRVSLTNQMQGITMQQTQFIIAVGEEHYTVSVTQVTQVPGLVENVFKTLYVPQ